MPPEPKRRWDRQRRPRRKRASAEAEAPDLARCLLTLAAPLVPQGGDASPEDYRRAITLAAIAWNAAARPDTLDDALAKVSGSAELRGALRAAIGCLMEQKLANFAEDKRRVASWQLETGADGEATLLVRSETP